MIYMPQIQIHNRDSDIMLTLEILTFCHIILEMALLHNSEICKRCWVRVLRSSFREMSGHLTATTPKPVKRKLRSQAETVMAFLYVCSRASDVFSDILPQM